MEIGMNFETNCLALFPLSRIAALRIEVLTFQQKEMETLGAAWARFISLINSGPKLSLPDHILCDRTAQFIQDQVRLSPLTR